MSVWALNWAGVVTSVGMPPATSTMSVAAMPGSLPMAAVKGVPVVVSMPLAPVTLQIEAAPAFERSR